MDRIALWFAGMGVLHAGHLLIRVLIGILPKNVQFRDPPFWSVGLFLIGGVVYWKIAAGLRRRVPAARAAGCVVLAGWLLLTLVAVNTGTRDVLVPEENAAGIVEWKPAPGPVFSAMAESWRGTAWIGMLSHPGDFLWVPSGAWSLPEVTAALVAVVLAFGTACFLLTVGFYAPDVPARSSTWRPAPSPERSSASTRAVQALGIALVIHLSFFTVLTLVNIVGITWRLVG